MKKLLCLVGLICLVSIGCAKESAPKGGDVAGPESTPGYGDSMMQAGQGSAGASGTATAEGGTAKDAATEGPATEGPAKEGANAAAEPPK